MKRNHEHLEELAKRRTTELKKLNEQFQSEINKHKKIEKRLRDSETKLSAILNNMPILMMLVDKERRVRNLNHAALKFAGCPDKEMIGLRAGEALRCLHSLDDPKGCGFGPSCKNCVMRQTVLDTFETGRRHCQVEAKLPFLREGKEEEIVFFLFTSLIKFPDYYLVLVCLEDITNRKRTEEELRKYRDHLEKLVEERTAELTRINEQLQQEIDERRQAEESLAAEKERLDVTLRSLRERVIATDTEGKILLFNKAAENSTGWTQEEAIGQPLDVVFHIINEKTRERCEKPIEKIIKLGGTIGLANHTVLISRDGTERLIDTSGATIYDKEDNIIGVVLIFRDITEKRKIEEELLKVQKLESIGMLAGGIAHDFNNILAIILGNAELAEIYSPGDKVLERLARIENAAFRAEGLTQQLLTFAKGGAPIKETASISKLIKDTAGFTLSDSNVKCELFSPDDLWPVEIDIGQMSQVVNNLIINAREAMPKGGTIEIKAENIIVGTEEEMALPEGKYIKLSFKDQGVGISKEQLPKIFDPFFTTKEGSSGLGLSTTFSIIKKHGGLITAKPNAGAGTTFYIYLPASSREILTKKEVEERPFVGQGRILLMDDEEDLRNTVGEVLNGFGYEVELAKDGAEVIEMYQKNREAGKPFDVLVMDLTIPGGMGGQETIRKLIEINPEVKAIVSSGYSNDPVMSDFKKYGFCGFIAKPYNFKELAEALNKILG